MREALIVGLCWAWLVPATPKALRWVVGSPITGFPRDQNLEHAQ